MNIHSIRVEYDAEKVESAIRSPCQSQKKQYANIAKNLMRKANMDKAWWKKLPKWLPKLEVVILYYAVSCWALWSAEGMEVSEAIYFLTASVTTVGYGDVTLQHPICKMIAIPWILFGIIVVFSCMTDFIRHLVENTGNLARKAELKIEKSFSNESVNLNNGRSKVECDEPPVSIWIRISGAAMLLIAVLFLGVLVRSTDGEFTFVDKLWWSFQTITTVGYGDISPPIKKFSTRILASIFMIVSVSTVAFSIGQVALVFTELKKKKSQKIILSSINSEMIEEMDKGGNGVDINEYIVGMLQILQEVDVSVVETLRLQFHEHDHSGDGFLDKHDLQLIREAHDKEMKRKTLELANDEWKLWPLN